MAATKTTIRAKLDASRKDLLDLGMRNSLLNFRLSKARGAEIIDELSSEVYRVLVQGGKSLTFLPAPEEVTGQGVTSDAPAPVDQLSDITEVPAPFLGQPGDEES